MDFANAGLERWIAGGPSDTALEALQPRDASAWTRTWPDLTSFAGRRVDRPLRVCIATEDVVGPMRNGGIGSTYAALADLLVADGHDVTILYLRGQAIETGTREQWEAFYAARGCRFVAVPNFAQADGFATPANPWLVLPYNLMRYLLAEPFDVCHVSEWRGAAWLALLVKRQKIALQSTTFVVKASSPLLWGRLYGQLPLEHAHEVAITHAERMSMAWADVVVSGSTHLLRFMAARGYELPAGKTFVQPNVIDLGSIAHLAQPSAGGRLPVSELVFFGRLEPRKGVVTFCRAVDRLLRTGDVRPQRVTFLGKAGASFPEFAGLSPIDAIRRATATWPFPVAIDTDRQQGEALEYLRGAERLAVMPSVIENSSLALYECALCGIPFVASNVGGNAELLHPDDAAAVLVDPHPIPLAQGLSDALRDGGLRARPAFDNAANLAAWRAFHRRLGPDPATTPPTPATLTVCLHAGGGFEQLKAAVAALAAQTRPAEHLRIGLAQRDGVSPEERAAIAAGYPFGVELFDVIDLGLGRTFDLLCENVTTDGVVCVDSGTRLHGHAIEALAAVLGASGADLVCGCTTITGDAEPVTPWRTHLPLPLSVGLALLDAETGPFPLAIHRRWLVAQPDFATDIGLDGVVGEYAVRALLAGAHVTTLPLTVGGSVPAPAYSPRGRTITARPVLAAAPLALGDPTLVLLGQVSRRGTPVAQRSPKVADPPPAHLDPAQARLFRHVVTPSTLTAATPVNGHLQPAAQTAAAQRTTLRRQGLEGHVDKDAHAATFHGWVWSPADPNLRHRVAIYVDGLLLTALVADQHRDDLAMAGIGAGTYGFSVAVPASVEVGSTVDVVVAEYGLPLIGGTLRRTTGGFKRRRWLRLLETS